jgi:Rieske Fe-S protein
MAEPVTRRRFLDFLLGGGVLAWLGAVLYPLWAYLQPPVSAEPQATSVKVGPAAEIPPNTALIFKFGRKPGILVHTPEGRFRAFEATCTHLDCTVQYKPDWRLLWCACHNGRYNLDGINISGPPPRPLEEYIVHVREGDVYVSRQV